MNVDSPCLCPDLASHSSDYGYFSSIDGSDMGSREGSDVACSEGICNHDETGPDRGDRLKHTALWCPHSFDSSTGVDSNTHLCDEDKHEDAEDSSVECWPQLEETPQCTSEKKKRKGLCNKQVRD